MTMNEKLSLEGLIFQATKIDIDSNVLGNEQRQDGLTEQSQELDPLLRVRLLLLI